MVRSNAKPGTMPRCRSFPAALVTRGGLYISLTTCAVSPPRSRVSLSRNSFSSFSPRLALAALLGVAPAGENLACHRGAGPRTSVTVLFARGHSSDPLARGAAVERDLRVGAAEDAEARASVPGDPHLQLVALW